MIRHIVLFKLKNGDEGAGETIKKEIKERLDSLPGRIGVIRSMEAGINLLRSERAYDLALVATFDSLEDLESYRVHPAHREFIDFISPYREKSVAVDYSV